MGTVKYGILHNHTEHSARDSAMSIKQLFERAKELGAPAVALTDHGILTGIIDFMKMGKEYEIKAIPGIEAYYVPDGAVCRSAADSKNAIRSHLILMAKDLQGYHAICRANFLSYQNILRGMPCMDKKILRDVFGPGAPGHGHVIATSACVNGVLATILLEDDFLAKSTEKLTKQRDKYHPVDSEVGDAAFQEEQMAAEIEALIQRRDELTESSKVNLSGLKRTLKAMKPTDPDYESAKEKLDSAAQAKQKATEELTSVKRLIAEKKRAKTAYSKSIASMMESAAKWANVDDKINAILKQKKGDEALYQNAKATCQEFAEIFGEGNWFVELQYHHIKSEAKVMPVLAQIADELHIPVVAANDAHYATKSHDDIRARTLVAAMRFNEEVHEDEEGFGELYIRDDDELYGALWNILSVQVIEEAFKNIGVIVDACNVEFEHGTHYPVYPGDGKETAAQRLRRLAEEGIPARYPGNKWTPELQKRMDYELGIIEKMGYCDYLCVVQDYLDYGRRLGYECPEKIGYTIGPGRGSGAGSIVCYLTGITSIDPIRYNLLFERFLNPDRVSMPELYRASIVNPIAQGCMA